MSEKRQRLSPDDWISAGFRALVDTGPDFLGAEPLARGLGTTKGSFYWHFQDLPDFLAQIITHWNTAAKATIHAARAADGSATQKLQRLAGILTPEDEAHGGAGVERAMRAWAQSNSAAAEAVAEIDGMRHAYIADILRVLGLTNPDFPRLVYGAYLGMTALPGTDEDNAGALSTLTAALLALQDA